MSEDKGYSGNALSCLKKNNVKVGDSIKITARFNILWNFNA